MSDSDTAEDAQSQGEINPLAIKAVKDGISEQAERQIIFQTAMHVGGDPDPEATQEFQQELFGLIKHHLTEGETTLPEVAIALWDEINDMAEKMPEPTPDGDEDAKEEGQERTGADEDESDGDKSSKLADLLDEIQGEADSEVETERGRNDPTFH